MIFELKKRVLDKIYLAIDRPVPPKGGNRCNNNQRTTNMTKNHIILFDYDGVLIKGINKDYLAFS